MTGYLIAFSISLIFLTTSMFFKNKNKMMMFLLAYSSIIPLCFLSGMRAFTVGTDVLAYGLKVFQFAISKMPNDQIYFSVGTEVNIAYIWLNRIIAFFTVDPHMFLAVLTLLTVVPVLSGLLLIRDLLNPVVSWSIYLLIFFPETFNLLKQSLSCSLLFLGYCIYIRKGFKKTIIVLIIISMLIHSSSIVGVLIFITIFYLNKTTHYFRDLIILSIITGIVATQIQPLMNIFLVNSGLFSAHYQGYSNLVSGELSYASYWPIFLIIIMLYELKRMPDTNLSISLLFPLIMFILLQPIALFNYTLYRVLLYMKYFIIISYPIFIKQESNYFKRFFFEMFPIIVAFVIFMQNVTTDPALFYTM